MPNLRTFVLEFKIAFVIFEISALEFVLFQSLVFLKKSLIWDQKYLIWVFLDWNLKTILSSLKSPHLNLPS